MKRLRLAVAAACVSFAAIANAEELRLKTRIIDTELENPAALKLRAATAYPRSISGSRWHWLVQFESASPDLNVWQERGAKVLSSVPVNGFIIAAPQQMSWEGLDFRYRAVIEASDKMSPQITTAELVTGDPVAAPERSLVIVHFHKDVESWEADGILDAEGVTALKNGSLSTEDRLAELTPAQMAALALWDEVEYVFPAPQGLKDGEVYMSCGGVMSAGYEVAMLAASFGEGWDGPGRGQASISYSFGGLGTRTDPGQTKAEVRRALSEWSRVVAVNFTETTVRNSARNIDVLFATGEHWDPFPFL
ncbi:MAG: matrixin family metalloprotease, partial [Acidobacteria bacterium]|nr:matrixin family metalloprotease [Acidobacteriota bacterium]